MIGIVQTRNNVGNVVEKAAHARHHQVGVVELRYRRENVAFRHARLFQRVAVGAHSLNGRSIEIATQVSERIGIAIDDAHVVAIVGKHIGKLRPNSAAPNHDNVAAHSDPFLSVSRRCRVFVDFTAAATQKGPRRKPRPFIVSLMRP